MSRIVAHPEAFKGTCGRLIRRSERVTLGGAASITPQGAVDGAYTISLGGEVMEVQLVKATIEINPDCTGRVRFGIRQKGAPVPVPGEGIDEIVVLNNGDEIVGLSVQGFLGHSRMKRISMMPLTPQW